MRCTHAVWNPSGLRLTSTAAMAVSGSRRDTILHKVVDPVNVLGQAALGAISDHIVQPISV